MTAEQLLEFFFENIDLILPMARSKEELALDLVEKFTAWSNDPKGYGNLEVAVTAAEKWKGIYL